MTKPDTIKKLSIARCAGKMTVKRVLSAPDHRLPVLRVVGLAVGVKSGISDLGDWTALIGDFGVTNLETGEEFRGSTLYMPDVAQVPIEVQIKAGAQSVQFALEIIAKGDDNSPVGFSYAVEQLVEPENDPIARMMEAAKTIKPLQIANAPKAPAPAPTPDVTPSPTPAPTPTKGKGAKAHA